MVDGGPHRPALGGDGAGERLALAEALRLRLALCLKVDEGDMRDVVGRLVRGVSETRPQRTSDLWE